VRDAIAMTKLGLPEEFLSGKPQDRAAIFSPDHERVSCRAQKGNLERNTNEFSVLLYERPAALKAPAPRICSPCRLLRIMKQFATSSGVRMARLSFSSGKHGEGTAALSIQHCEEPSPTCHAPRYAGGRLRCERGREDSPCLRRIRRFRRGCQRIRASSEGVVITTQSLMDLLGLGARRVMASKTEGGPTVCS